MFHQNVGQALVLVGNVFKHVNPLIDVLWLCSANYGMIYKGRNNVNGDMCSLGFFIHLDKHEKITLGN